MPRSVTGARPSNAWEPQNPEVEAPAETETAEIDEARSGTLSAPETAPSPVPPADPADPVRTASGPDAGGSAAGTEAETADEAGDADEPDQEQALIYEEEELQKRIAALRASRSQRV